MTKAKFLKNTILTTIITLFVGLFSFLIFAIINSKTQQPQPKAATAVNVTELKNKVVKDEYGGYISYDALIEEMLLWEDSLPSNFNEIISALQQWMAEVDNTYGVGTPTGLSYIFGTDPGECNIILTADINCSYGSYYPIGLEIDKVSEGEEAIFPFTGTFDGNGFTIRNFTINDGFGYYDSRDTGAGLLYGCGFFAALSRSAVVKNLRLENMTISSHNKVDPAYSGSLIGGIAGCLVNEGSGKATITNCVVDGLSVNCSSYDATRSLAIGGILGANPHFGAIISNCLVNKISFYGYGSGTGDFYMANIGGIVGNDPSSGSTIVTVKNCVVNKDKWSYTSKGPNSYGSINDITSQSYSNCYSSKTGDGFENLGSNLNKGGESGSTWYCIDDFNGGWPYLRQFVKFSAITFDTDGDGYIESRIYVPTDNKSAIYAKVYNAQSKNSKVTIYGDSVSADTKTGYTFDSWNKGSSIDFIATFKRATRALTFLNTDSNPNVKTSTINLTLGTRYSIYYGDSLTVKYVKCKKETQFVSNSYESYTVTCLSSITYQFTDIDGVTRSITYTPADGKYFIGFDSNWKSGENEIKSNYVIAHSAYLKSYDITFG